jgi:hypothetical protein
MVASFIFIASSQSVRPLLGITLRPCVIRQVILTLLLLLLLLMPG